MKSISKTVCAIGWLVVFSPGCNPPGSERPSEDVRDLEARVERLEARRSGTLEKLFAAMDVNSNKRVSADEFEQHTRRNFTLLVGRMDTNGNGVISKEEFAERSADDTLERLFSLDHNQDHLVTRAEAARSEELWFLQRLGNLITVSRQVLSSKDIEDHFTERLVRFSEKIGCDPEISEENYLKWHLPVFDQLDFNADKKISFAELRRHKQDTAARMLAAQHAASRGFEYVGPGKVCEVGGSRCIGFHLPESGGGGGFIQPGSCGVCDPASDDYSDFLCIYMGEIVNCSD